MFVSLSHIGDGSWCEGRSVIDNGSNRIRITRGAFRQTGGGHKSGRRSVLVFRR